MHSDAAIYHIRHAYFKYFTVIVAFIFSGCFCCISTAVILFTEEQMKKYCLKQQANFAVEDISPVYTPIIQRYVRLDNK